MTIQGYEQLKKQIAEANEQIKISGKELFAEAAAKVFADNPELKSFRWHQYTPYFDDGNECVFRVCGDYLYLNENDDSVDNWCFREGYFTPDNLKDLGFSSFDTLKKAFNDARDVVTFFEDDHMQMIFGDHCQITVNSSGTIEIEEYSHD